MNEEKDRIEKMLAEGRITREEADGLLAALEKSEKEESISALGGQVEEPRMCITAILGVLGVPAAIVLSLLLAVVGGLLAPAPEPGGPVTGSSFMLVFILVMFMGLLLSVIALIQISGSRGKLHGKGLAIAGIIIPVVFVVMSAVLWSNQAVETGPRKPGSKLPEFPAPVESEPLKEEGR